MFTRRNIYIGFLVLILAGLSVYQHIFAKSKETVSQWDEPANGQLQQPAPSFTLKSLDGESYTVGGQREKPLIINFWASWCDPCHEEAPDIKKLSDKYKDKVDFYAVNITQGDTLENARQFVKQYGFNMPVLLDTEGTVKDQYRVIFIPTSFLIDRNGMIRETVHLLPVAQWEKKINALLKNP
jgi:thiol-disulfide isomerase/thioredoxin